MKPHIPHVTSKAGAEIATATYQDSTIFRLPLEQADKLRTLLPKQGKIWIDPCFDGCDDLSTRENRPWTQFMESFSHFDKFRDPEFIKKPVKKFVDEFVSEMLDRCNEVKPSAITVPQFPAVLNSDRNKINLALAKATGSWKASTSYAGKMILPVVLTHQGQIIKKTARTPKVQSAERCYNEALADGYWAVDKSLTDDNGSPTLRNKRFPALIALHEELNSKISTSLRIAGPYWAMNIVLWARGLVDCPLIGLGSGYQFFLSGGHTNSPSAKIAIPSLRRRVTVSPDLRKWLDKSLQELDESHPTYQELFQIRKNFTLLGDPSQARIQVAQFYKGWFDSIAKQPTTGRSMSLFQDLATAYTVGKSLPNIEGEGTARRPESVAESLMMSCL